MHDIASAQANLRLQRPALRAAAEPPRRWAVDRRRVNDLRSQRAGLELLKIELSTGEQPTKRPVGIAFGGSPSASLMP
jgi:hypothetical protein